MGDFRRIMTVCLALACLLSWGGGLRVSAAEPYDVLLEGLLLCEEAVELTGQGLSPEALSAVYTELLYGMPELFHVAPRLSFSAREGVVDRVYPVYTLAGEELDAARRFYRDTVTAILSEMEEDFGGRAPSEAEVVVYLHDHLADRYAYDTRGEGKNADAYSFFRDGVGVCQAYALAFVALAQGAGLESDLAVSAAMDHAWNHVRVDGVWYHVDVTRDDPIPAAPGSDEVNHARLLCSDGGMEELGYFGFSCVGGHTCDDTRYEGDLAAFHGRLIPFGQGFLGDVDGAPVAVTSVEKGGFSTGQRGDVDGDDEITPADLLTIYGGGGDEFEAWRKWVREEAVR